jgi:hypothetical protein
MINDLLSMMTVQIRRQPRGRFIHGHYEPGPESEFEINASVQPLGGRELMQLPEGDRKRQPKMVFTKSRLQPNDIMLYECNRYEIQKVEDWTKFCTGHYRAWALRCDDDMCCQTQN